MTTITIDEPMRLPKKHFASIEELIWASLGSNPQEAELIEDFFLGLRIREVSNEKPHPVSNLREKYAGIVR